MKKGVTVAAAMATVLLLGACGGGAANNAAGANAAAANGIAAANAAAPADAAAPAAGNDSANASGLGDTTERVTQVASCILETPEGHYDGSCERVESGGGPSFSIRRAGGAAFYGQVTEAVVEVDRPGEAAGGSYRKGGELVSAGPLTFRDDCACWVRPNMRVGAQAQ